LAATAWARPLTLPDEGRYVGIAWEMLRSGDWLTPRLDGLPFLQKPPLFYWITAASLALFGPNAWAARSASLLGGTLAAFSTYLLLRRWSGGSAARATLAVLLVQPLFFAGAQFANLDMLVAGCITATIALIAHAALCRERGHPHRLALVGAYGMAALGVLAKGLIGAVLPGLVVIAWFALARKGRMLRTLVSLPGIALFLLISMPWFVAMQSRFAAFSDYFFVGQHVQRFVGSGFNNAEPFWFFPAVLALLSLPFLPWLRARVRHGSGPGHDSADEIGALAWVWLAAVVIFFSVPESKLLGYVLPAVPALAVVLARGLQARAVEAPALRARWWTGVAISASLGLGTVAYFSLFPTWSTYELAQTLRDRRGPDEPVFMLGRFYYDVPFVARLQQAIPVVDDWSSPEVLKRDNWRRELAEAGAFAPARASDLLVAPASLAGRICRTRVSWAIGPSAAIASYPFLAHASAVATRRGITLWRVAVAHPETAAALGCTDSRRNPPLEVPVAPAATAPARATRRG